MSAPVVAVTSLLIDVLSRLEGQADLPPSEAALRDLFWPQVTDLLDIKKLALQEMHALAPALLAGADAA